MIAKVTTHETAREKALNALCKSLYITHSVGPAHNIDFLLALAQQKDFAVGDVDTGLIERNLDELISKDPTPNFAVLAAFIFANDIDPMAAQLGWQNWGNSVRKTGLIYDDDIPDKVVEILGSGRFILGDSFEDTSRINAIVTANFLGIKYSAHCVVALNGMVSVKFEGRHYTFQNSNPLTGQANQAQALDEIMSPMTGRIIDISVSKGDKVVKGQAVAVVEAMKMEHRLIAPRDGTIEKVNCVIGDAVDDGKVLISLIQAEADHA
jgi:3-methylcrotonyl-CoA carboxylase alpha subunit